MKTHCQCNWAKSGRVDVGTNLVGWDIKSDIRAAQMLAVNGDFVSEGWRSLVRLSALILCKCKACARGSTHHVVGTFVLNPLNLDTEQGTLVKHVLRMKKYTK